MDEIARRDEADLYETDFYAWSQRQAALLGGGDFGALDLINLVEEIESLGRAQINALQSRYAVLCLHLLNQRLEIARHIAENPSLKPKADGLFNTAYADARRLAASETGLSVATFPITSPFSRELIQSDDWYPKPVVGSPDVEPAAGG